MSPIFIAKRVPSRLYSDIVPPGVNVLVVDVNQACLAVTEAKLLHFGYSVLTAGGVEEATSILEDKSNDVHLVLAEAYFPGMDRFVVLEKLGRKFNVAVVILSDDEDDYVMLEALSRGAYFYLVKPIAAYDVKNLWQFALAKKREEYGARCMGKSKLDGTAAAKVMEDGHNGKDEACGDLPPRTSTGERQGRKRRIEEEEKSGEGDREGSTAEKQQKAKVTWTSALHERFLQAMKALGSESRRSKSLLKTFFAVFAFNHSTEAHPKKILQHMNMSGLRKEHISSHLQKYRLFLKKEEEEALKSESLDNAVITPAPSSASEIGPSLYHSSLVAEVTRVSVIGPSLDTQSSSGGSNYLVTNISSMKIPEIAGEPPPPNHKVPESFCYGLGIEHGGRTHLLGSFNSANATRKVGNTRDDIGAEVTVSNSGASSAETPSWEVPRAKVQDAVKHDNDIEHGMMELEELVKLMDDSDDPDIN